jgi:2-dehydropantoate 2-reductase
VITMKSILIIGAGSIGCLFGARLAITGVKVKGFFSTRLQQQLENMQITFTDVDGLTNPVEDFKILNPSNFEKSNFFDFCIISTKVYSLDQVCQQYLDILDQFSSLILLENGLGNEEIVQKYLPTKKIYRLITSNGAIFKDGNVSHTGWGDTYVCDTNSQRESYENIEQRDLHEDDFLIKCLTNAGFNPIIAENPLEVIWRKAFINIGINAFGALTQLSNGELFNIPPIPDLISRTILEGIIIAQQLTIPLDPQIDYAQIAFDVIQKTKKNRNSMLQDIINHRATEIDFLNGKIVELGLSFGIPTPLNQMLTALVKGREYSNKLIREE